MHSRALKVTFVALALSGVLLVGCKKSTKGNTPITGQIPTTTTTAAPATTSSTMMKMPETRPVDATATTTTTVAAPAPTTTTMMPGAVVN